MTVSDDFPLEYWICTDEPDAQARVDFVVQMFERTGRTEIETRHYVAIIASVPPPPVTTPWWHSLSEKATVTAARDGVVVYDGRGRPAVTPRGTPITRNPGQTLRVVTIDRHNALICVYPPQAPYDTGLWVRADDVKLTP